MAIYTATASIAEHVRVSQESAARYMRNIMERKAVLSDTLPDEELYKELPWFKEFMKAVPGLEARTQDSTPTLVIDISRVPGVMAALDSEKAVQPTKVQVTDVTPRFDTPAAAPDNPDDPDYVEPLALTGDMEVGDLPPDALGLFVPTVHDLLLDMPPPSAEDIERLRYDGFLP
jgi:hypothetical protein